MEIGLHLPSAQAGANAEDILAVARAAEALDFDSVWMFDHLFTPTDLASKYPYSRDGSYVLSPDDPFFDPLGLIGVLAGATSRVKIGTGVLVAPYRHPIVLGKALATIEQFAPGRIVLGIGAGWMEEEFRALGMTLDRRGARFDEILRALRALWSGKSSAFEGEFYSWPEAGFLPAPTRAIPLVVGGHTDVALKRAARLGDGWAVVTGPGQGAGLDAIATRLATLRGFLAEAGRADAPFTLVMQHQLWFSDTANPKLPFTGPPEVIAANLRRARDLGIAMVDLMVFGPRALVLEAAERFAREVRPLLA